MRRADLGVGAKIEAGANSVAESFFPASQPQNALRVAGGAQAFPILKPQ